MAIQPIRGDDSGQALRARRCPELLAELIRVVNFIPPEFKLPGIDEVFTSQSFPTDASDQQIGESVFEAWRKFLEHHFPSDQFAQLYECLGPIRSDRVAEISDRYNLLASAQALLMAIANAHGTKIDANSHWTADIAALVIDTDGRIQVKLGPLLEVLKGVEAGRIRQCSECKRVFWAGRIDKFACLPKCVQRRRVRIWRQNYPEHYKIQRVRKANAIESKASSRTKTQGGKPNDCLS
jgi:hypothetical protein